MSTIFVIMIFIKCYNRDYHNHKNQKTCAQDGIVCQPIAGDKGLVLPINLECLQATNWE